MLKKDFVTMILGTIGGLMFALGMCMALLPEWNAFREGIIMGTVGIAVLVAMILIRRKMEGKTVVAKLSGRTVGAIGVLGPARMDYAKVLATLEGISGNVESLLSPDPKQIQDGTKPPHDE